MNNGAYPGHGGYEVDASRLLRLVGLRRGFRLAMRLAGLGFFGCAVLIGIGEALEPGPSLRLWGTVVVFGGLVVSAAIFLCALLAQLILRGTGFVGRVAAALVPLFGVTGTAVVHRGQNHVHGLVRHLSRRPVLGFPGVVLLGFGMIVACFSMVDFVPAWRANMGYGGQQVTIGEDAHFSRTKDPGGRSAPRHYLDTPLGEVRANGDKPEEGERWLIVLDDGWGNREAYRVGGLNYVFLGAFGASGVVMVLGVLIYGIFHFRRQRQPRQEGAAAVAASLRALSVGNRAQMQVWLVVQPWSKYAEKPRTREFVVGCPPDLRNPMGNR